MSELTLLADCLKDATKERDDLADALQQAQEKTMSLQEQVYGEAHLLEENRVRSIALAGQKKYIEQLEADKTSLEEEMIEQDQRITELEAALFKLVDLKYWKDRDGKTSGYLKEQSVAWQVARDLLEYTEDRKSN